MIRRTSVLALVLLTLSTAPGSRAMAQDDGAQTRADRIFELEPETPRRLVISAYAAARLNYTQIARGYLQQVVDKGLSNEDLMTLREQVGLQTFMSLHANADLQPMAGELLQLLNDASFAAAVPPGHAEDLVARLGTDPNETVAAGTELLTLGNAAVDALLKADIETQSGTIAYNLLRRHPRQLRFGIFKALNGLDFGQQRRGLLILATTADSDLAPLLLRYEFGSDSEAVRQAASRAVRQLWSGKDRPRTADKAVEWLTNEAALSLASAADRFSPHPKVTLSHALRLAEVAVAIDSAKSTRSAATLLACRAATSDVTGEGVDASVREAALEIAIQTKHSVAAAALLQANPDDLRLATQLPGATVRVKAAAELLNLNQRVRGAAFARRVLTDAAEGSTSPEAVVIDPRLDAATEAVWLLQDQGYDATRCLTGQAGFERAASQLSCELILIHSNCVRWNLSQTVANLRADSRTAQTPIAVYGPRRDRAAIRQLQHRYPGVSWLPGPLSEINFVDELRRNDVPGPILTEETRSRLIELAATTIQVER